MLIFDCLKIIFSHLAVEMWIALLYLQQLTILPEWSKGVDSSSTSASCVGSNPTGVNFENFGNSGRRCGEWSVRSGGGGTCVGVFLHNISCLLSLPSSRATPSTTIRMGGMSFVHRVHLVSLMERLMTYVREGEWAHKLSWRTCVSKKNLTTLLDLCVSSLRRGHANLLCIVPILADDPRGVPIILYSRRL